MWYLSLLVFFRLVFFQIQGFKSEPYVCNGCPDLMQRAINFDDAVIVSVKESI